MFEIRIVLLGRTQVQRQGKDDRWGLWGAFFEEALHGLLPQMKFSQQHGGSNENEDDRCGRKARGQARF